MSKYPKLALPVSGVHWLAVIGKNTAACYLTASEMQNQYSIEESRKEARIKVAKESSRYAFIAAHRGGPITKENHRKLMKWARECSEHVLSLLNQDIDKRLAYALQVAKEWENDDVPTGKAMKASLGAHAAASESTNPVSIAVARSIGQAVATAHMADHCMGAALYALKALRKAGKSIEAEREWQNRQLQDLPSEVAELIRTTMIKKEKSFKIE